MLRRVSRPEQVPGSAVMRQHHKLTAPIDGCGNLAGPIQFAEGLCFADVVNTPGSLWRYGCQSNGCGNIFDVTARRSQRRNVIGKDDLPAAVVHAFEYGMETVYR